jgi:hypothetical protein
MMFYDTERIVRKQEKYEKSKAYDVISALKHKGLNTKETLACIEVMSFLDSNNESQIAILNLAHQIVTSHVEQEHLNAESLIIADNLIKSNSLLAGQKS